MGIGFNAQLPVVVVDAMAELARLKNKLRSCPEEEKAAVRAGIQDQLRTIHAFHLERVQALIMEIRALHEPTV